jgi:hypothetical protein
VLTLPEVVAAAFGNLVLRAVEEAPVLTGTTTSTIGLQPVGEVKPIVTPLKVVVV